MAPRCALVVMARYPEPGAVKTRLARTRGAAAACRLYLAFVQDLDARFRGQDRDLVWAFHPPDRDFAALVAPGVRCLAQEGDDLGERMHRCFRRLCAEGYVRVVMIGADIPHVRDEWIADAETALDHADVALGPATDGGYYLVAMRAAHDVFTGVPMGTPRVLHETRAKAARAGLRVQLLPESFDVDTQDDLTRLRELLRRDEYAGWLPRTAAVLASEF